MLFIALKWLKTSIEGPKCKFDSTWASILRQIDADLMSVCWKKHIVYRNMILVNCACLAITIKCRHTFMFLAKLFETCSLPDGVGVFGCYSMLTTLPLIFKTNNVNTRGFNM